MFAKISLKKLVFLSLGVLIIGALTNCGGSGGGGSAAPAAKKAPAKPTCSISDQLDIKVSINGADEQCLLKDKKTLDFVLNSIAAAEEKRTWDNSKVSVALLQISEDATAKPGCANASGQSVEKGWVLDFSSSTSCEITVSLKNDSNTQVVYTLKMVGYGISEADDFKIPFFASAAARFVLTKNIDLTEEKTSFAPSFNGQLDGLDHTINGLSIEADSDDIGLISQVRLSADDSTVEIKNLTLGITKLVGNESVGGLIGGVWSDEGAKAVQIKDVTVKFAEGAMLQCSVDCGGLVGYADTSVHFSGIVVKGEVSAVAGQRLGGVIGNANASQLTDVTAHFNIKYSGGERVGLVAGEAKSSSTLSKIDASGVITCTETCTKIGGVVGMLDGGQLSQVKSSLQLTLATSSNASDVGGVAGHADNNSTLENIDFSGQITCTQACTKVGGVVGYLAGASNVYAAKSVLELTGGVDNIGGVAGYADNNSTLENIDFSGQITCTQACTKVGGVVGQLEDSQLSQAKSVLELIGNGKGIITYAGGVAGEVAVGNVTRLYAKLTVNNAGNLVQGVGAAVGNHTAGTLRSVVSHLTLLSKFGADVGGVAGDITSSGVDQPHDAFSRLFASGSISGSGDADGFGQMIGNIGNLDSALILQHVYTGEFTGDKDPKLAIGSIAFQADVLSSYTRADKFVADGDVSKVTFDNVYATTAQTGGKPKDGSADKTSVKGLPDSFEASILNDGDSTIWTNEYDNEEYKYPMLAYPKEDMGPISEADWFELQIKDNEKK